MGHVPFIDEFAIVIALAVGVSVLLAKLRLPTVTGLLAAGALMGPFGLKWVTSVHAIEVLAEVGVVFLLFSIGLEFSLTRLKEVMKEVALGGLLQVGFTIALAASAVMLLGGTVQRGLFYGFVFALSSTAIVLRALAERRELDAPHGRVIVGTLIFQDLCVVPMVLIVPMLGQATSLAALASGTAIAVAKATCVVVGTVVVARKVVPKVLEWVDASRSRETFLLAMVGLCIGTAWLTSLAGLSLALGAFLGGMVVADTEYGHRAMGDILPLRDVFVSIFFVSLGMLFDARAVIANPLYVVALLVGFLVIKGMVATLAAMALRFPARVAWLAGVGLAQFGEFGFVLTKIAQTSGVLSDAEVPPLLAAGIMSMFLTPILVRAAPHFTAGERLLAPIERLMGVRSIDEPAAVLPQVGHVVVVGFGVAGQHTALALRASGAPFVVLELNAANVKRGKAMDLPVYYADATSEEALRHAHIDTAKAVVLLMNDAQAAARVVDSLRRVAPNVPILMRTRYLAERDGLIGLGASDVVAEEVEGAVEIISRVLRHLEVPRNRIEASIKKVRTATQGSARKLTMPRPRLSEMRGLEDLRIESALVYAGSSLANQTLAEAQLRSRTGALVVGVRRNDALIESPDPKDSLLPDDIVYLVGTSKSLRQALPLFGGTQGDAQLEMV